MLLHGRLRLQLHHKLVPFGVDELLAQAQEGKRRRRDNEGEVQAAQGKDQAWAQRGGHRLLAHQRPLAPPAGVQVLQGGTGAEVTLQESLRNATQVRLQMAVFTRRSLHFRRQKRVKRSFLTFGVMLCVTQNCRWLMMLSMLW